MHSEIEKLVITLLVMRSFSVLLGAPIACLDFREPTAVSRFNGKLLFGFIRGCFIDQKIITHCNIYKICELQNSLEKIMKHLKSTQLAPIEGVLAANHQLYRMCLGPGGWG